MMHTLYMIAAQPGYLCHILKPCEPFYSKCSPRILKSRSHTKQSEPQSFIPRRNATAVNCIPQDSQTARPPTHALTLKRHKKTKYLDSVSKPAAHGSLPLKLQRIVIVTLGKVPFSETTPISQIEEPMLRMSGSFG